MNNERELQWEDVIESDGPEFIVLPEGDYEFEVTGFERARHAGSEKLPACNKAIIHLKIEAPQGSTTVKHNLFLHTITEGMLCAFFTAIGHRKKGEKLTMNWNKVIGSKGKAKVGVKKWTNDEGRTMEFNEVKKFYEPTPEAKFEAGRF